jgi:arylsulfatase
MHVADIMPTLLEVAGTSYPKTINGHDAPPLMGKSWGPLLAGKVDSPRSDQDYIGWEIFGNRAVRQGDWKLRWEWKPIGKGEWELFNVAADPAERKDLAAEHPDKVKALTALWDSYVRTNHVVLPSRSMFETLEDQLPKRVPDDAGYPPLIYKRQFVPPKDMTADPKP